MGGFWVAKIVDFRTFWHIFSKQISKRVLKSSKNASKARVQSLTLVVLGPRASLGGRGDIVIKPKTCYPSCRWQPAAPGPSRDKLSDKIFNSELYSCLSIPAACYPSEQLDHRNQDGAHNVPIPKDEPTEPDAGQCMARQVCTGASAAHGEIPLRSPLQCMARQARRHRPRCPKPAKI